jgi:hypothetical protein
VTKKCPGATAYHAYVHSQGNTRPDGKPYPKWSSLTPNERDHWVWAAGVADTRSEPQQYELVK